MKKTLNFIFGSSGSGKTEKICEIISEKISKGEKKIIFLSPEQNSFESERRFLSVLGEFDFKFVNVLNFKRLRHFVYEKLGYPNTPRLTRGQRNALMSAAFKNSEEKMRLYSGSASFETVEMISDCFKEIKNSGIDPQILRIVTSDFKNETLKNKIYDISVIISEYEKIIKEKFTDSLDDLAVLFKIAEKNNFFSGFCVFIDEFASFSAMQIKILELIIKSSETWVSLNCSSDFQNLNLTDRNYIVKKTAVQLSALANKNSVKIAKPIILDKIYRFVSPELKILEENLFKSNKKISNLSNNIEIYEASDIYDERNFVACNIRKLIIEKKYRYSNFAVVTSDIENYGPALENIFKKYEIPYFYDYPESILYKNLMIFVFAAIDSVILNFKFEDIFRFLKTGLTKLSTEEISEFENYCLLWDINEEKFKHKFKNKENSEKINEIRKKVVNPLLKFQNEINGGKDISEAVYHFLTDSRVPGSIKKICEKFIKNCNPKLAEEQARLWDILMISLDEAHGIFADSKISVKRYAECLKFIIRSNDISFIPRRKDEVTITEVRRMRLHKPKTVFMVGASEGDFPEIGVKRSVFNNFEKKILAESGLELGGTSEEIRAQGIFHTYTAAAGPSEKLFVSYCSGESKYPNELIREIHKIFPGIKTKNYSDFNQEDFLWSKAAVPEYLASASDDNFLKSAIKHYFKENEDESFIPLLERAENERFFSFQNSNLPEIFFGKKITLSASQVETFYSCPFGYFCKYAMNAKKRPCLKFGRFEYGSLVHYILEKIFKNEDNLNDGELENKILNLTVSYAEKKFGGFKDKKNRFKFLFTRHAVPLRILIRIIEKSLQKCGFKPIGHELRVSEKNGNLPPLRLKIPDGISIKLEGKIDRADSLFCKEKQFIRIVDYKTGSVKFNLEDAKSGVKSQMILYMAALRQNASEVYGEFIPAGIFYFPAVRPVVYASNQEKNENLSEKISRSLSMNGIVLDDGDLAANLKTEGTFKHGKKAGAEILNRKEMENLINTAEDLVKQMAGELLKGKFSPASKQKNKPCDYCEFFAICLS